jgi:hypothetical protein
MENLEQTTPDVQDNVQESVEEVSQNQPNVVDTSTEQFFYDRESAIENVKQQEVQQGNQLYDETQEQETQEENVDSAYKGSNENLAALYDWAEENQVDLESTYGQFDEENFTEDQLRYIVGQQQALKHVGNLDPALNEIISKGVNLDQYINERVQIQQAMNTDDSTLFKGQMYNYLLNKNIELGVAQADEQGNLSQQSHEMIIEEIDRLTAKMSPEQFQEKAGMIRQQLQQEMNAIPTKLAQQQQQAQQQYYENYEAQRKEYLDSLNDIVNKSKSIVVGFADQSAKDDFIKFVDDQTSLSQIDVNGKQEVVVPLFHRLQNDSEFLMNTLRLHHMMQNGYFTDTKNKARTNAYRELGIMPKTKGKSGRKGNHQTYKGAKIADTSSKDFFKR